MHVWECPCYILEPQLQDRHKLPKWKPQSHWAALLVFHLITHHSYLWFNTRTGKISSQFHVVFGDWFTSVTLVGGDKAFDPSQWQELFTTSRYQYIFNSTDPNVLSEEWIDNSLEHDHE